jgi:putative two-component system response regulator
MTTPQAILCDDDPFTLTTITNVLETATIPSKGFTEPHKVIEYLQANQAPLVAVLDVNMPKLTGYQLAGEIKKLAHCRNLPIVFLTARNTSQDEAEAFTHGAADFIPKPFNKTTVVARVKTQIEKERTKRELEAHRDRLAQDVAEKTAEIRAIQEATTFALVALCGQRDQETGEHIARTRTYVQILAKALGLPGEEYGRHAPLHDIGKVAIPDIILLKPGKLTLEEFEVVKTHTTIGHRALQSAVTATKNASLNLEIACQIVRHHHERWDGRGYPDKLKTDNIPLAARLMAIADVYDALRSQRPYKRPMSHKEAMEIIVKDSGSHFDPACVRALVESESLFEQTATTDN